LNQFVDQIETRWPHRVAVALAIVTFPVIWMGGLVTTYEAGMAVPDWPTTYGYNLFLYPWQTWLFGPWDLFIEHGHRLLAATAGLLSIALLALLWRGESRRWVRWLGAAALALVIFQGVLGGLRVRLDERLLARIHGCVGPAYFALVVAIALFTSAAWRQAKAIAVPMAGKVRRLALLTTLLAYLQIVVGAHLRHQSLTASPGVFQTAVIFHLFLAGAIAVHAVLLAVQAWRLPKELRPVSRPIFALAALVSGQLLLGGLTWIENYGWPLGSETYAIAAGHTIHVQSQLQTLVTTAHVAVGSLILATSLGATLAAFHWQKSALTRAARVFGAENHSLNHLTMLCGSVGT
jgi:cytochrome c oxidase assembly protein subunit 15